MAARRARRACSSAGTEYSGFEGAVRYLSGFRDRAPLRLRAAPARGRPDDRLPERGPLRRRARRRPGSRSRSSSTAPASGSPTRLAGPEGRRLRARLRDDGARLPGARAGGRARRLGRRRSTTPAPSRATTSSPRCARACAINTEGFWVVPRGLRARAAASARSWRRREEYFVEQGCGRQTMDMVLVGENGSALPEFKIAGPRRVGADRHAAALARGRRPGRPLGRGLAARSAPASRAPSTQRMMEAYDEYFEAAARERCATARPPTTSTGRSRRASSTAASTLGHVTGHSIGMTMIEYPKIGEGDETELRENMVFSMHPHAISEDGQRVPLHAGHVARHRRRRRPARRPAAARSTTGPRG